MGNGNRLRLPIELLILFFTFSLPPVTASADAPENPATPHRFSFFAMGDMPYKPADYPKFEKLIAKINAASPAFSIHVGDFKSGSGLCSDKTYLAVRQLFEKFERPIILTPGDNDWADCDRASNGSYDPNERLEFLRNTFFAAADDRLRMLAHYARQSDISLEHDYVENAFWIQGGIAFVTIHMVGWENNLWDDLPEFRARNAANIDWIELAYEQAMARGLSGLVIAFHADPFGLLSHHTAFRETLAAIASGASRFGKPVLMIHGDRHSFALDQPLRNPETREPLGNLTRLSLYGGNEIRPLEVIVDVEAARIFTVNKLF